MTTVLLVLAGLLGLSQPTSAADGKFVNLSTRGWVGTGGDVRIVGFIIEDDSRQVLIQALGPELVNRGISNALADPVLSVTNTTDPANPMELMVNDNWEDSQGQLVSDLWGGSPPLSPSSLSAAVVLTLEPGNYTAKVEGKNGTVGVAIVEVFRIASTEGSQETTHGVGATVSDLPSGSWTPDVSAGGVSFSSSGGNVTLRFNDGSYIEEGNYRYTCQGSGGCAIENRDVTSGTIVQTAKGTPPSGGSGTDAQPSFTSGSGPGNQSYTVGTAISALTLPAASGGDGSLTYELTPSIPGLSFNPTARRLTGTPTSAGTHSMTYTVADADGDTDSITFTITVAHDAQPSFASGSGPGNQSYTVDTAISALTLPEASDGDGMLTYKLSPEVPGLTFDPNSRQLTGTPTTAASYNMTYTVTDEDGDTDTISFTVTVKESDDGGDLREMDFALDPANRSPEDITFANDKFYVLDGFDDKVFAYNASGQRDAASEFDLDPDNRNPTGITFANDKFYVLDGIDDKVYAYNTSGQRDAASEFDLDPGNRFPEGITFANDKFYVPDGIGDKVYAYNASGLRDTAYEFDLDPGNRNPAGITFANDRLYVPDGFDDAVYAYIASGQRDALSEFDLDPDNDRLEGITFANGKFYVLDGFDDKVYAYNASRQRDAASEFDLDSGNRDPEGINFANDRLYVPDGFDDKVYVYIASGQRDSLSEFDLDPDNRGPEDITFANDKYYVLDGFDDKIFAYNASGQRDAASEFDLNPDNDRPVGITYINDKFYVLDGFDDKVYAYNISGQRDAASEFDLDPGNDRPEGITFANDRFHVADSGDLDWVFAYHTSGQRDAASDFHLDSAITSPSGITYGNGSFYVLDSSGLDRVYVVASTQQLPDLVVRSMAARDNTVSGSFLLSGITVTSGDSFQAAATALNRGTSASAETTLRFFRSDDRTISTSDSEVGMVTVEALSAAGTSRKEIQFTAPSTAGTYYYGACIESVSGESDTENNCSSGVRVTVLEPAPDLVVESASVSDDTPESGGSFMLSVDVRNRGTAVSTATTLRYYRSDDRTISSSDTEVGMAIVGALAEDGTVSETISLPAPSTEGTYYYGACVESVSGESNTSNNCSSPVVVFGGGPFPAYDLEISSASLDWPFIAIIGQSSISMTVEVVNQGPNASQPAKLRFSGGTLSYLDIPVLQSGESTTFEDHVVGKARIGTTTYRACIVEAPGEEYPDNNCRSRSVTYLLSSPPDEQIGTAE